MSIFLSALCLECVWFVVYICCMRCVCILTHHTATAMHHNWLSFKDLYWSLVHTVICYVLSFAAVIFRYNLVSFAYLLLLLIIFLLPGPRLKAQKGTMAPFLCCGAATPSVYHMYHITASPHYSMFMYCYLHGCMLTLWYTCNNY